MMEHNSDMPHLTNDELEAGVLAIAESPSDHGRLELIVRRLAVDQREILLEAELNSTEGLAGDTWSIRTSKRTDDGSPHPDMQLNIINARAAALIAVDPDRRALAGDQLHIDLDLSERNLPAGTRLAIGSAIIEVTDQPHTGCAKFAERFGMDAARWVNSPVGKELKLRGINARVVTPGVIRAGDIVTKV
jgi:hypothetical protein